MLPFRERIASHKRMARRISPMYTFVHLYQKPHFSSTHLSFIPWENVCSHQIASPLHRQLNQKVSQRFCELFFFKNAYQLSETAVCGGHSIASIAIDQRYVSPKYLITIHVSKSFLKNQFPNWNLSLFLDQSFLENEKRKYWGRRQTPLLLPFKSSQLHNKNGTRLEMR